MNLYEPVTEGGHRVCYVMIGSFTSFHIANCILILRWQVSISISFRTFRTQSCQEILLFFSTSVSPIEISSSSHSSSILHYKQRQKLMLSVILECQMFSISLSACQASVHASLKVFLYAVSLCKNHLKGIKIQNLFIYSYLHTSQHLSLITNGNQRASVREISQIEAIYFQS